MLPSVVSIVLVNMIPIIGVLWLNWKIMDVMLSYWMETLVICLFTFLKIIGSQKPVDSPEIEIVRNGASFSFSLVNKGEYALKFLWNSLTLSAVHLLFVWFLFGQGSFFQPLFSNMFTGIPPAAMSFSLPREWIIFAAALLISHGYSFLLNYCFRQEYLYYSPKELMVQPYRRVVAMMVVLLVGGWLINRSDATTWALIVLIVAKIVIDILSHLEQHRVLNRPTGDDLVTQVVRSI